MVRDNGDSIYFAALEDALTVKTGLKYDSVFTETIQAPGPVVVATNFSFEEFKGGKLRIGISMRGFELTPRAAIQWYGTYSQSFGLFYINAQSAAALAELAGQAGVPGGLNGVSDWVENGCGLPPEQTAEG